MSEDQKKKKPEKEIPEDPKFCPFNPENSCADCRLEIDGFKGKKCVFIMAQWNLQGIDMKITGGR